VVKNTGIFQNNVILPLLGLGFIFRYIFSSIIHPLSQYQFSDMQSYLITATRISRNFISPINIFYPPGYSLFLHFISKISQDNFYQLVAIAQSFIGIFTCLLLFDIARKIISKRLAIVFLFTLTIYYPWIDYTGYLLSENLATFFLVLITWLTYKIVTKKINYILMILLPPIVALGSMVRANLFISGLLCLTWIIINKKTYHHLDQLLTLSTSILFSALFMISINYSLSGISTAFSLNGGLVFAQGQCRYLSVNDSAGWCFGPPVFVQRGFLKEKTFDQPFTNSDYFYRHGLDCLKQEPTLILHKFTDLYYLFFGNVSWPSSNQPGFDIAMRYSHYAFAGLVIPGLLLGLYRYLFLSKAKKKLVTPLYLVILSLIITTVIYHADIRYRVPFDGIFILLALWGYQVSVSRLLLRPGSRN